MSADLTPQQRAAVEHRGTSVVLSSGAGCGKTHVLTKRYLSHLAADLAEVPQVVAITFTERAAREMRGRIRAAVAAELAAAPAGSDAAARWRQHLRQLETAPITTIHSFCGTLLRQHAYAAGLDPAFEVLDDPLAATLRTEALTAALHRLLTADEPTGEDLRELVVLFGWAAVREAIDGLLLDPDPPAWTAWLARSPDEIAAEWLTVRRPGLLPGYAAYLRATVPDLAALGELDRIEPATPEGTQHQATLRAGLAAVLAGDPGADADGLRELASRKQHAKLKKVWGPDNYPRLSAALGAVQELCDKLGPLLGSPPLVPDAAAVGQRFLRVAQAAAAEYGERKGRAAAVDFHDLLVLARDLLRDHAGVRDDLRRRFQYLLLDELQDTDPVQMELVELLCGAGRDHGKLFAVGDSKQSIYRFRGADVGLFRGLREAVPAAGRLTLTRNYRSRPGVIRFVNAVCRGWFPDEPRLEAHRDAGDGGACVEFLWSVPAADKASGGRQPPVPATVPDRTLEQGADAPRSPKLKESAADVRAREADAVARRVVELIDAGRCRPRDVVLLFRSMTHVAAYESALRRHGLDYYLVGGRAFFAQQEVYDLLHLLRALDNPQDGPALAGTLRSPFCNLSDEALHVVGTHKEGLWAGLFDPDRFARLPPDQRPAVERARRFLAAWRAEKDRLPIARLLGRVFADSGYDAATQFEFLGDRKLANLWKLADLAREFDRTGLGLAAFAARLADLVARQPREEQAATQPENADVVRLMSVHQSKGLEFPVVIVPDLGALGRGDRHPVARWHRDLGCLVRLPSDVLEDEREAGDVPFAELPERLGRVADTLADWREDLRVLYVACTRARDLLILSAGLPEHLPLGAAPRPPAKAASHWLLALADRYDLRTGECHAADVPADEREPAVVRTVEPSPPVPNAESRVHRDAEPPPPFRIPHSEFRIPPVVSLPALERFARGEPVAAIGDGHGADGWATVREQLDPLPAAEAVFWRAASRWRIADADGWQEPLTDALAELPDPDASRLAEQLTPLFGRFAGSALRSALLEAEEVRTDAEFLLDLGAVAGRGEALLDPARDPLPVLRGLIDVLYRDAGGWHVVLLHLTERPGRSPWRDAQPTFAAAAWAVREALGALPRTVGVLDLVAGEYVAEPARKLKFAAGFAAVRDRLTAWRSQGRVAA